MQKILPHLWFDTQAKEATAFYAAIFPDSRIDAVALLKDTPSGDCDMVYCTLMGQEFMAISAGPYFTINPSISFMVNFDPSRDPGAREIMDDIWSKLAVGGKVLMPLETYPFSPHYGWIEDRFGVSWQLILTNPQGEPRPTIMPSLLFVGDVAGKASGATEMYLEVFAGAPGVKEETRRGMLAPYPPGMEPDQAGDVMFTDISLAGQWLVAMDSRHEHQFAFNEGISLVVRCESQEELDYFWNNLARDPKSGQCGWIKDRFGVSWQITPSVLDDMMRHGTQEQINRVMRVLLPMQKLDIAPLVEAFHG